MTFPTFFFTIQLGPPQLCSSLLRQTSLLSFSHHFNQPYFATLCSATLYSSALLCSATLYSAMICSALICCSKLGLLCSALYAPFHFVRFATPNPVTLISAPLFSATLGLAPLQYALLFSAPLRSALIALDNYSVV